MNSRTNLVASIVDLSKYYDVQVQNHAIMSITKSEALTRKVIDVNDVVQIFSPFLANYIYIE